jgi:hypothetical protein
VQVGGDSHAAPFIGGVDQTVEALGGVGAHRQESNVVNLSHRHRSIYAEAASSVVPTATIR